MHPQETTRRIQVFVSREFLVEFGNEVTPETDLFEKEIVDSFGFVELVSFIESEFGIKLSDDDMGSPEIASVAGMVALIHARMAEAG